MSVEGLSTLLSGRIRCLQHLSDAAAVTHAPIFSPRVQRGNTGGSGPSRRKGETQGTTAPACRRRTMPRDQPVGREGQWKLSCWRPFAWL